MNNQLSLALQFNPQTTLADFCWGANTLLKQQLDLTLHEKGERLLYVWGNVGCGKTHLLQGCCQKINNEQAIYLPLTLLKAWGPDSIEGMGEQKLIAVDDIDSVATDKGWETALFHLYNRVYDNGKTILIITSQSPPGSTRMQLPDLRSRLSGGLVMQMYDLSDDLKMTALQQHALKRGFDLPHNAAFFLVTRCARNMRALYQILDHLDEVSLAAQRKITIPFIKSILNI